MASIESATDRKIRLTHEAQQGRDADDLLSSLGDDWVETQGRKALAAMMTATPDDLFRIQAEYKAAVNLVNSLKSTSGRGKRAAETLNKEARNNG